MITLVLGGARSGKSAYAEKAAARSARPVLYVATAVVGDDADFAARVRRHQERRPSGWSTAETGADLVGFLRDRDPADEATLLIDSLGTWVASQPDFAADARALCRLLQARAGDTIVVSEEVGLGVHPSTAVGGRFRDALGSVNQEFATVADRAYLIVAGRPLALAPAPEEPG